MNSSNLSRRAMQAVAVMEAVKGIVVIAAGFGLLTLLHRDVRHVAEALVTRLHLDPKGRYVGLFLDAADNVTDTHLWVLAGLALAYAVLRGAEGWGLWMNRTWAAWLGAAGGALYLPVEAFELAHRPSWIKLGTLLVNLAVVAYLVWALRRSRQGQLL